MSRRGLTLVEVLITSTLFLMALTMCAELAVIGMRTQSQTIDKNQAFRGATIALDQLNRDLLHCTEVLSPPLGASELHPGVDCPSLVLRTQSSRVIGYRLQAQTRQLTRLIYDSGFDLANPSSQTPASGERPRVTAWIVDFSVRKLDPAQHYGTSQLRTELLVATVAEQRTGPTLRLGTQARWRNP